MNDTQLAIVISVINDAADQLAEVGTQLSTLGTDASAAAATMSSSLTEAENAAADAAVATAAQWDDATTNIEGAVKSAADSAGASFASISDSALGAANAASEGWQTSLADLKAAMATTSEEVDAQFAGMGAASEAGSNHLMSSVSSLGGKLMGTGFMASLGGGLITGGIGSLVSSASASDQAMQQLTTTVQNVYASAQAPTAAYKQSVASLTDQINLEKAAIIEAHAAEIRWNGTTIQVTADHIKAGAAASEAQSKLVKLQGELDTLTQTTQLAGGSASATAAQFKNAADSAVTLGFNVTDSAQSLNNLFGATHNVNETMLAFQDAMDLARNKNLDLATASNDLVQAMQGNGRALRDLQINAQDNLSPMQALSQVQSLLAGSAQKYVESGAGPMAVAMAKLNKLGEDTGNTLIPAMSDLATKLDDIITKVDAFVKANPQLTAQILGAAAGFGAFLLALGPVLIMFGTFLMAVETFNTLAKFTALGNLVTMLRSLATLDVGATLTSIFDGLYSIATIDVGALLSAAATTYFPMFTNALRVVATTITETVIPAVYEFFATTLPEFVAAIYSEIIPALLAWAAAALLPILPYVLIGLAIAAFVVLVVLYHKQIMDAIQAAWTWIVNFIRTNWEAIVQILFPGIGSLVVFLFNNWKTIQTDVETAWNWIETFIQGVWNKIATAASTAVSTIQNIINTIMAPIQGIMGAISGFAGNVGNGMSSMLSMVPHLASGGIVNGPTFALVGEAGPEAIIPLSALRGGSISPLAGMAGMGGINVYIQGGTYLDTGGANMIAQALATQIGRQIKLKNYV